MKHIVEIDDSTKAGAIALDVIKTYAKKTKGIRIKNVKALGSEMTTAHQHANAIRRIEAGMKSGSLSKKESEAFFNDL